MRNNSLFLITAAFLLSILQSPGEAKTYFDWKVGQEREVDEGYYFTLLKVQSGWRLWKIETENGVECTAVKSAIGQPHPVPLGYGRSFFGGAPRIVIQGGLLASIFEGSGAQISTVKTRVAGTKFWTGDGSTPLEDGAKLDVNIVGWKYPQISAGRWESTGTIDLSGLNAMRETLYDCAYPAPPRK